MPEDKYLKNPFMRVDIENLETEMSIIKEKHVMMRYLPKVWVFLF